MTGGNSVVIASVVISLAISYHSYVKYKIHKTYSKAIEIAVERAVENRVSELVAKEVDIDVHD
jgi:hypothetical protein